VVYSLILTLLISTQGEVDGASANHRKLSSLSEQDLAPVEAAPSPEPAVETESGSSEPRKSSQSIFKRSSGPILKPDKSPMIAHTCYVYPDAQEPTRERSVTELVRSSDQEQVDKKALVTTAEEQAMAKFPPAQVLVGRRFSPQEVFAETQKIQSELAALDSSQVHCCSSQPLSPINWLES